MDLDEHERMIRSYRREMDSHRDRRNACGVRERQRKTLHIRVSTTPSMFSRKQVWNRIY